MEIGSSATPFEHKTFAQDLQECQRYYRQWASADSGNSFTRIGNGPAQAATHGVVSIILNPPMRAIPSATTSGQLQCYNGAAVSNCNAAIDASSSPYMVYSQWSSASGMTVQHSTDLICDDGAANKFALSAEL